MNTREFSRLNRERCEAENGFNHKLDSWSLSDWFTATLGELGEAANVAKKLKRALDGVRGNKETEPQLREMLRREVADTVIYLDLLAQRGGFDLWEAVRETWNAKAEQLGYPGRLTS